MASNTIQISLEMNEAALKRSLERVAEGEVLKFMRKKSNIFIKRLTEEIGKPAAEGAYGSSSIEVRVEQIPRGWKLIADGEAVGFLEFGAGTMSDKQHPFAQSVPFEVKPGSWSLTYGSGQFIPGRHEKWYFGGREYRFIQPRRGLYQAYTAMLNDMRRIAIEVFNTK